MFSLKTLCYPENWGELGHVALRKNLSSLLVAPPLSPSNPKIYENQIKQLTFNCLTPFSQCHFPTFVVNSPLGGGMSTQLKTQFQVETILNLSYQA